VKLGLAHLGANSMSTCLRLRGEAGVKRHPRIPSIVLKTGPVHRLNQKKPEPQPPPVLAQASQNNPGEPRF
jgi:hypothetical protein